MPDNKYAIPAATTAFVLNSVLNVGLNGAFEAVLQTVTSASRFGWMLVASGVSTVATYAIVYTVTGLGHATFFVAKKAANGVWNCMSTSSPPEHTTPTEEELQAWQDIKFEDT